MLRFFVSLLLFGLSAVPETWAAPSRSGAWKVTELLTDAAGKTVACNPFCGAPSLPSRDSVLCTPADMLASYADQQMNQAAMAYPQNLKNCLDGDEADLPHGHSRALVCDDAMVTLSVLQPDDRHLSYAFVTQQVNRTHPAPQPWPQSKNEWNFEWLEAGCDKANGALRER